MGKSGFRGGGFGGMGGMNQMQMMKQAQKMQEELLRMQEELEQTVYTATAGGGVVTASVSGKRELTALEIDPDEHGLHIRANLGGTEIGRQLFEEISGGYTTKMSFGFRVGADKREETEERHEDGTRTVTILRTILSISNLYDVSAVSLPANDATSISARSFADGVISELAEEFRKRDDQRRRIRIKSKLEE